MTRPVWAEINLEAIGHNVREIRRITAAKAMVMAVVKANGYGHGAVEVAAEALANGAERLAIAILEEGIQLRRAGFGVPILILGNTPVELANEVVRYNLTQTVFSFELAEALSWAAVQQRKTVRVHLKVDTGMGRIGFLPNDDRGIEEILRIARLPNLEVEGIFTHFATSDAEDKSYTEQQFQTFMQYIEKLKRNGIEPEIRHCANSAAIIDLPGMHLDMVRAGIILYGLYPSDEVDKSRIELRPAMSLRARVAHVKEVPAASSISYGRIFATTAPSRIATLPLGYADGYTRLLSNKAEVLIGACRAPVVGRICMDQCMVDVTALKEVNVGDEAVLFGRQGSELLPVDELAAHLGTINYELVCMVSNRVPRVYVRQVY